MHTNRRRQGEFYEKLALEMIKNTMDLGNAGACGRRHHRSTTSARLSVDSSSLRSTPGSFGTHTGAVIDVSGRGRSGMGAHLTPCKRYRKTREGDLSTHCLQGKCRICGAKSTNVCSMCEDKRLHDKPIFLCHSRTNRDCFSQHA
jgi:hypothetical protein